MTKEHVNTQKKKNLKEILMSAIEGHEGTILNILCLIILIAWGLFELVIQKDTTKLPTIFFYTHHVKMHFQIEQSSFQYTLSLVLASQGQRYFEPVMP